MTEADTTRTQYIEPHMATVTARFKGGRVSETNCANEGCGVTKSSLWRKGWPLEKGEHANLCNPCGIKYRTNRTQGARIVDELDQGGGTSTYL